MYAYVLVSYNGEEVGNNEDYLILDITRHDYVGQGDYVQGRLHFR